MIYDLSKLTVREREVYAGLRDGKSRKETAEALGISLRTVMYHRNSIFRKFGIPRYGSHKIQRNYQDSLKDCEFNVLLAIASFAQRLDRLEAR